MTMYVFCSECGWKPKDFFDLTRRQMNALMKGREKWFRQKAKAEEDAEKGIKPREPVKGGNYRTRAENIHYNKEAGNASIVGVSEISKAIEVAGDKGKISVSSTGGMFEGLSKAGGMDTKVWRGGVKRKDRPKSQKEKIAAIKREMAHNEKHYGID